MRRLTTAVVFVLGVGGAAVVAATPAAAVTPPSGTYHALTSAVRVLNTQTGTAPNRKGALASHGVTRVQLGTHVASGATAALISLTSFGSTANGSLTAYKDGATRPGVTSLLYPKGVTRTVTVLVALAAGRFDLYNGGSSGSTQVAADVVGYFSGPSATSTAPGALTVLTPKRVASAITVAAGKTADVQVGPKNVNTTAALTLNEYGATKSGSISVYPKDVPTSVTTFYVRPGSGDSSFTLTRVGTDGYVTVANHGSASVRLSVDTTGYLVRAAPSSAGALQALEPQRIYSGTTVAAGKVGSFTVAGKAGVPVASNGAVVVAVSVARDAHGGNAVVGGTGKTSTSTRTVSFAAGETTGSTTIVPAATGKFDVRNTTTGSLAVYVDVLGYLPSNTIAAPATTVAHYLDGLTEDNATNASSMSTLGCADAKSKASLVLLDIGAQSYRSPQLSTTAPGVAVALTNPTVRLTYPELVSALQSYLEGFQSSACTGGATPTARIAIGTSNSGNFRDTSDKTNPPYPASTRGTDWFTDVVHPLQQSAGSALTVIGASDIENGSPDVDGFDDQYGNALNWETAYLAAAGPDGTMIYNGSANDCPTTFGSNSTCSDGWTLSQFTTLTHKVSSTKTQQITVLPQIYSSQNALQWANIDRVAKGALVFEGSLTEYAVDPKTFTPAQGWTALDRALSSVVATPKVPLAVDIAQTG